MNNLLRRLRPLDYVLFAAFVVVGLLLFTGGSDTPTQTSPADGVAAASWDEALVEVVDAVQAGDTDAARTAFAVAAQAARREGEPGTARAIESAASRLTTVDLDDIEYIFRPSLDEDLGPGLLQFVFAVTSAMSMPDFPAGRPTDGNAWGEILFASETEGPSDIYWATVNWSAVDDNPLALKADLSVAEIDLAAELTIDFAQPGMFVLTLEPTPDDASADGAAPFSMASAGEIVTEMDEAAVLEGKVSAFGNRVTLQLAPGEELDSVRALEAADEIGTTIRFDDDSTMFVRFQISSAARDLFRRVRDHILGGEH